MPWFCTSSEIDTTRVLVRYSDDDPNEVVEERLVDDDECSKHEPDLINGSGAIEILLAQKLA